MPVPDAAKHTTIQGLIEQIRHHSDQPVILTEGDSWFSFPLHRNVVDHLLTMGHFSVLRLEKPGDELLRMLDAKPLRKLKEHLDRTYLTRGGKDYRAEALLMSGGGNDLLGDDLVLYLKANPAGTTALDFVEVDRVLDKLQQIGIAYRQLCWARDDVNPECTILAHGYDYAVPGDRPVRILWGLKKLGPWMHKAMNGEVDPTVFVPAQHRRAIAAWLVDEFNQVLATIAASERRFVHVDSRGSVGSGEWNDEIHPRSTGFEKVARKFEGELKKQFPGFF